MKKHKEVTSRHLASVAAFMLVFSTVLVTATVSSAASPNPWSKPASIDAGRLVGQLSCAAGPVCVGVDSSGRTITYHAGAWSSAQPITTRNAGLTGVSCASSSFCVAITETGDAFTYGGKSWSPPAVVFPHGGLDAISCPTRSICWALDDTGEVASFNGQKWSVPEAVDNDANAVRGTATFLSCPTASFCLSADANGDVLTFNGSAWSQPQFVSKLSKVSAISCSTQDNCIAVSSGSDHALTYDGKTWSTSSQKTSGLDSVSCSTTTFCMAVSIFGDAYLFNGHRWSTEMVLDRSSSLPFDPLALVSCVGHSFCMTTGVISGKAVSYQRS